MTPEAGATGGTTPRRVAVLASGGGSNLAALLSYFAPQVAAQVATPAQVVLVASDRPDAGALRRAADAGVAAATLADPADGAALLALLDRHRVDLVVLAGYLKLVPATVVARFRGAMLNIHPALLPRHGGAGMYGRRVHAAVLASGDARSGATVHFVDPAYDRGAPIASAELDVRPDDTPESLASRVLIAEHFLLPRVVDAIARGYAQLAPRGVDIRPDASALFTQPPSGVIVRLGQAGDRPSA